MNDILEKKVEKFLSKIDLQEYSIKSLLLLFARTMNKEIVTVEFDEGFGETRFYMDGRELNFQESLRNTFFSYDGAIGKLAYLSENEYCYPTYGFVYADSLEVLEINSCFALEKLV